MDAITQINKYLSLYPNDNCNKSLIRIKYWLGSISKHNFKHRYKLITEMFETMYLLNNYFVNHDEESTLLFEQITDLIMDELNERYQQWFNISIPPNTPRRVIANEASAFVYSTSSIIDKGLIMIMVVALSLIIAVAIYFLVLQ